MPLAGTDEAGKASGSGNLRARTRAGKTNTARSGGPKRVSQEAAPRSPFRVHASLDASFSGRSYVHEAHRFPHFSHRALSISGRRGQTHRICSISNRRTESETLPACLPATIATGFPGAGKPSLIHSLIENANRRRIALIINTSGETSVNGMLRPDCGGSTACMTVGDARRFAGNEESGDARRQADSNLKHGYPLEELFVDQLGCAELIVLNRMDLVAPDETSRVETLIAVGKKQEARIVQVANGRLPAQVLIGPGAAAERKGETEHDHDDFESFVVLMPFAEDMQALSKNLAGATRQNPILRAKGFLAVRSKPARPALQSVGPRIETYFDRPLRAEERSGGYLVVIGLKGLDRAAIAARLGGRI